MRDGFTSAPRLRFSERGSACGDEGARHCEAHARTDDGKAVFGYGTLNGSEAALRLTLTAP
jgi:hypothetical protein